MPQSRLSELDSALLDLESENTPLNTGGAFLFRKRSGRSKFGFTQFKAKLEAQLDRQSFFRSRLVQTPLGLEASVWAEDPNFDLDRHLNYVDLRERANPVSLDDICGDVFSRPLNRSRPLWSVTYVDGLETEPGCTKQHFALIVRMHLTAVDGNTGEDILSQLLALSPEDGEPDALPEWLPDDLPATPSWLEEAYRNATKLPNKLANSAAENVSTFIHGKLLDKIHRIKLIERALRRPYTRINKPVSNKRVVDSTLIDVHDIRMIRAAMGDVTTNDVLMGICAEALMCYLADHGDKPSGSLTAIAPVAVRSTSLEVGSGRQLAANLFSLATEQKDPIERIRDIHKNATQSRHYEAAISAPRLTEVIPSSMAALSARVCSESLLGQKHKPLFNLPIANIPGPQFPLYLDSSELVELRIVNPLYNGLGLSISMVSYNEKLCVTTTYCPHAAESSKRFSNYLQNALGTVLDEALDRCIDDHPAIEEPSILDSVKHRVSSLLPFSKKQEDEEEAEI